MNDLTKLIESFGVARLGAIVGVGLGVAAALALIIARIGEPSMTVLYADIEYGEAQGVIARLDQDGVDYQLRDNGGRVSILAPRDDAPRLRMELSADGVIATGGVGYEIFDEDSSFGATSFQQNINRLRALEGELARTISSLNGIRSARVHLVLQERQLFSRDGQASTASIVVDAPTGVDPATVRAIVNLAASAAPDLNPSNVTVLDSRGTLLAAGGDANGDMMGAGNAERKAANEARIRKLAEDIVGKIVGPENVRVEVTADMDFSKVTESAIIVDPDSQVVLSSTLIEEAANDIDAAINRGVTVANALPGAVVPIDGSIPSTSSNSRTEEVTNYEISKTTRNVIRDEGMKINRLSVAVAINQATTLGVDGQTIAQTRSAEELARIEALVKSAVGFSAVRLDQIEIVEMAFQPTLAPEEIGSVATAAAPGISGENAMRLAELGALALIGIALVVFVLRPMFLPAQTAAIATPTASPTSQLETVAPLALPSGGLEDKIDLAQVEGQVKASSINKVTEIVKGHTDESVGILRNWIKEAS